MKNILLFLLLLFTKTIFSQNIEGKELELKKNSKIKFPSIEIGAGLLSLLDLNTRKDWLSINYYLYKIVQSN